jgi:hypothetical protein
MSRDPPPERPDASDEPLDVKPEPAAAPKPPPVPPTLHYGWSGPYVTPPPPRTTALSFSLRAIGGFFLFFASVFVAVRVGALLNSGIGSLLVFATAFAILIVVSFVFHRRGWLTGWLTGFLLAASLVGFLIYTCRNSH